MIIFEIHNWRMASVATITMLVAAGEPTNKRI